MVPIYEIFLYKLYLNICKIEEPLLLFMYMHTCWRLGPHKIFIMALLYKLLSHGENLIAP